MGRADFRELLAGARLKKYSGSVNLVLDTQGRPGLLIAAGSVDATDNYVLPMRPQRISPSAGKSLSYWTVANGYDTMVFLWNPTEAAQDLIFKVMFAGGHYNLPVHLGPKATQKVNLAQVVHSDVPDAEGHVIPADVEAGSAKIVGSKAEDQSIEVAMTSGIFNASTGTCYQQCITCDGVTVYSVSANPFGVAVNGQTQEHLDAQWNTGAQYDYTSSSSWSSSNTSVATVSSGLVSGVAGGSFSVTGAVTNEPVYANDCSPYPSCPIYGGGGGTAPGTVLKVTAKGPATVPLAAPNTQNAVKSINITATGTPGGGQYNWSVASGANDVALANPDTSTVTVTSVQEGTADVEIKYTLSGQSTSLIVPIKVQKPTNLSVYQDTGTSQSHDCDNVNGQLAYYGDQRAVTYSTKDQNGQAIPNNGMPAKETFSVTTDTCGVTPAPHNGTTVNGGFTDSFYLCSNSCLPANSSYDPTGTCHIQADHKWYVNGFQVFDSTLTMTCTSINP